MVIPAASSRPSLSGALRAMFKPAPEDDQIGQEEQNMPNRPVSSAMTAKIESV